MGAKKQKSATNPTSEPHVVRLSRAVEYDTMRPEDTIRDFLRFLRDVKSRYTGNMRVVAEYQLQLQDLEHYAEMADRLDRTAGHAFYRKMRDIRRERRVAKNEAELLEPLVVFIEGNADFIKRLEQIQGAVGAKKKHIDQLNYTMKTNVVAEKEDKK